MMQDPPSTKHTTLFFNMDTINKLIKVISDDNLLKICFNQKLLDFLKIDLFKMDTTSLKELFPKLEPEFGHNRGVFFNIHVPSFMTNGLYSRVQSGRLTVLLPVILQVYVSMNQTSYYNSTLEKCIADNDCILGQRADLEVYFTIAGQITTDKKFVLAFLDTEIASVVPVPAKTLDPDVFKSKLNNLIDLLLPSTLPSFDLSHLIPHSDLSVDFLDNQVATFHLARS